MKRRTRLAVLPAALALAGGLLGPAAGPAGAQEAELEEPPMAVAPDRFRLAGTVSRLTWADPPGSGIRLEGSTQYGVDVESVVLPYLSFRAAGTVGETRLTAPPGTGGPTSGAVDATQFVGEIAAVLRAGLPALRRVGAVPFVDAGLGTVVHDPEPGELITRSQTAVLYGAGLELDPDFLGAFGARVEWRRASVQLENVFVPRDRDSAGRDADRVMGALYWKF